MPSAATSPAPALNLGQILYAIHDTTLIYVPLGSSTARFQWVSFTGTETEPQASVRDSIDLGPFDDIRCARAVIDGEGKQEVALLIKTGLSSIATKDGIAHLTTVQAKVDDAVLIVGYDPIQTTKRSLALLTTSGAGFAVVEVDMDGVECGQRWQLPPHVKGTAVAAELVRRGSRKLTDKTVLPASTMLVVATIAEGSLFVHAVDWDDLAPQVEAKHVTTLDLKSVLTDPKQVSGYGQTPEADSRIRDMVAHQVAATATSMQAGSSDQQLAVAWADSPASGKLALVGWGNGGEATVLATTVLGLMNPSPGVGFYFYSLATADLLHNGTEQLVLGAPMEFDQEPMYKKLGAELMLFTLDESTNLQCESKYMVKVTGAPTDLDHEFWMLDLHIAAGLFGTCMGVQVIGSVFSLSTGAIVVCGFVPVDPQLRRFPPMTAGVPGILTCCVDPRGPGNGLAVLDSTVGALRYFAFPSGLGGESVVLGPPELTQREGRTQILAIIQAAPFDRRFVSGKPSVSYAVSHGEASGCSVSGDKSWTVSDDTSLNLGLGALNLSKSTQNTYLNSLSRMQDDSSTSNVTFHSNIVDQDYVLTYATGYNIWSYPVVRPSAKKPPGQMLVIVPQEAKPVISWEPAHNYAYRPRSEVGMLLSYLNVEPEAYEEANALFETDKIPVAGPGDISSLSFDKSTSKMESDSEHFSVFNSVSSHLAFSASTELFDELPATFGLNMGSSHSYSDSSVKTTHLTVHSNLNLSVSGGSVKDAIYEYEVSPIIYRHKNLGCLVLAWRVTATGEAWSKTGPPSVTAPQICLIRPVPESKDDPVYQQLSRSIRFDVKGDTVDIVVEIFNNSYGTARNVSCEFFLGKPKVTKHVLTPPEEYLEKVKLDAEIGPIERRTVTLTGQKHTTPMYVTVQLFMGSIAMGIYWCAHGPE